jgi:hypothetical protein
MFEQGISGSGSGNVRNEALPEAQQVNVIKLFFNLTPMLRIS